jgi:hypothetical protein
MVEAGAHLTLSALERLPHRADDYDLLRGLLRGPERNLFVAAQGSGVTLTPGAWKIIAISLLADLGPLAGRDFRSLAKWRQLLAGPPDTVLGASIALLGLLEALEAGVFGAGEALGVCRTAHVLAVAAREGGHAEEAYDLSLLGLGLGAPAGPITLAAAKLALDIAVQRDGGSRVGVCAVEVARAFAAVAQGDPAYEPRALAAWDFALEMLPRVNAAYLEPVAARLASAAEGRAFLAERRDRLRSDAR